MGLKAVSVSALAGLSAAVHGLYEAVAGMSATVEVAHAEVATPAGLATGAGDDADAAAAAADMMKPLAMTPELFRPRATTPELAKPELAIEVATAELATADVMKPMPMSQRLHVQWLRAAIAGAATHIELDAAAANPDMATAQVLLSLLLVLLLMLPVRQLWLLPLQLLWLVLLLVWAGVILMQLDRLLWMGLVVAMVSCAHALCHASKQQHSTKASQNLEAGQAHDCQSAFVPPTMQSVTAGYTRWCPFLCRWHQQGRRGQMSHSRRLPICLQQRIDHSCEQLSQAAQSDHSCN